MKKRMKGPMGLKWRIADRIDHPTPEKVGSIWNYAGREKTNEFGEYIGRLYNEKPWKIID